MSNTEFFVIRKANGRYLRSYRSYYYNDAVWTEDLQLAELFKNASQAVVKFQSISKRFKKEHFVIEKIVFNSIESLDVNHLVEIVKIEKQQKKIEDMKRRIAKRQKEIETVQAKMISLKRELNDFS